MATGTGENSEGSGTAHEAVSEQLSDALPVVALAEKQEFISPLTPLQPQIEGPLGSRPLNRKHLRSISAALLAIAWLAILYYWREFWGKHWGDVASVLGLAISIVGFGYTIHLARKAKDAAERAEDAAISARNTLLHFDAIVALSQAISEMGQIQQLHRDRAWKYLPPRYSIVRHLLVTAKFNASVLSVNQRGKIASVLVTMSGIDNKIEACLSGEKENPVGFKGLLEILKAQQDNLSEILAEIRSNRSPYVRET